MYEDDREKIEDGIRDHLIVFRHLVDRAASYLDKHSYEAAAAYAQLAAHYAWCNHAGLFASPQIENILLTIGNDLTGVKSIRQKRETIPQSPQSILHVLTQAYPTGGHTRLVRRWIEQDPERAHSIALTRQGRRSLPQELEDAVARARGRIYTLDRSPGGLLSRAKMLRQIASSFDQIVLHIHPYDVVPIIALTTGRAPVIFMNHADHVFWLGASISDVVAHFREGSLSLSVERRGIQPERYFILPLPLDPNHRIMSRSEAKKQLGFNEHAVVLLSVGNAYKYHSINGISFVDALLPILTKHEKAILLVVGPDSSSDSGTWAASEQRIGGRIKALGIQADPSLFYQAADIYLDSFPLTSLTSALDAGRYGVPLVRYHLFHDGASLLRGDDASLNGQMTDFTDLNRYQEEVSRLIEDEKLRLDRGERIRKSISDIHLGSGWKCFLENLYLKAATVSPMTSPVRIKENSIGDLDIALSWFHTNSGVSQGLDATVKEHSRLLPLRARVRVWANMRKEKRSLLPFYLLPESVGTRFERKIWR